MGRAARLRRVAATALVTGVVLATSACGGTAHHGARRASGTTVPAPTPTTAAPTTASATPDLARQPCQGRAAPATYEHVVVVAMENRTWAQVGGPGFGAAMPFLHDLAQSCAYYDQWDETNPSQSSLTQYVGLTSGVDNPHTVNDCSPSRTCASTDDNVFRAVRVAGGTARSYVEGATSPCTSGPNAVRHVPAMYYRGTYGDASGQQHSDADFCSEEVLPFDELDPNGLPTFAFVTPSLCHDGHDCSSTVADGWLRDELTALIRGASYQSGTTAILVWWDEDRPTPNLVVAPSALPGPRPGSASHAAALKTILVMLGLPPLPSVASTPDLRASAPL